MKIGAGGTLVNDDGTPVQGADGKPLVIQDAVESVVKDRLEREKARADKAKQELISEYEGKLKANPTPAERDALNARIEELTSQLHDKESVVASQTARQKQEWEGKLNAETQARQKAESNYKRLLIKDAVVKAATPSAEAQAKGAPVFVDPNDLFLALLPTAVWEPVVDERGKPTGEETLFFEMDVFDEKTKNVERKRLTAEAAAQQIAVQRPHWVQSTGKSGFPGGSPNRGGYSRPDDLKKLSAPELIEQGLRQRGIAVG
jgi:hypothetical protein